MNVLVANLGSTSFKYRVFRFEEDGRASFLAGGGYERVTDYEEAISKALDALKDAGHMAADSDLAAVGFKTVLGGEVTGCLPADDRVLEALERTAPLAPAHNPAYAAGIRAFRKRLPSARLVALFETAFYQWMPEPAKHYAVPRTWHEAGIRRYGYHGASHKFVAERSARLLGEEELSSAIERLYAEGPPESQGTPVRVISCHLGGSSSITGICDGVAIGSSMGMTPQSGLPQNNRVGDLDSGAVTHAMRTFGITAEEVGRSLGKESGLLGLSGVSNDLRDIKSAARKGNTRAQLALDCLVHSIRHWVGAFFMQMGGAEAIVFTGGIGENNPDLRAAIVDGWSALGVTLDPGANDGVRGVEGEISAADSRTRLFVVPANEELVVAREAWRLVTGRRGQELFTIQNV